MMISILRYDNDLIDVILQKNDSNSLYNKLEYKTFLCELYNMLKQFPQDYEICFYDLKDKKTYRGKISKDQIPLIKEHDYDYKKSRHFITGIE